MRIGLFGGAFNPFHNGHLKIAKTAIDAQKLDKLIFIPTGNAPHKKETSISRTDRLNMLNLAIEGEDKMCVSDYEITKDTVSYSADTTEYFKSLYPEDELFFIIGDDSYNQLSSWREPERILKAATLLVFPREGAEVKEPAIEIPMERVEISSSDVREKIKFGNKEITGRDVRNILNLNSANFEI